MDKLLDKSQISKVREELLSSHPDLQPEQLSDERLEAAIDKVSSRSERVPAEVSSDIQPSSVEVASVVNPHVEVPNSTSLESDSQTGMRKETMEAVLEALRGEGKNFTFKDGNLANNVDLFLGRTKKE